MIRKAKGKVTKGDFRFFLLLPSSLLPFAAWSQTTPIQPKTPEVPVPPPVVMPTFGQALAPLTEDEVVRLALRLQPAIEDARGAYESAQGRVRQQASNLGPTVGVTGTLSRSDSISGSRSSVSSSTSSGSTTGNGGSTGGTGTGGTGSGGTGTGGTGTGSGGTGTGGTGTGGTTTGNAGTFQTGSSGGLFSSGRLAIGVTQLLFDFGRTRDLVRQQRALAGAAGADLTRAQLDAARDARQRLADLAQYHRLVLVSERTVANRQAELTLAQANLESGLYPPKDVVDAKTNLANAVSSLVTARANEAAARFQLAQAIGVDPRTPLTAAETSTPVAAPVDPTDLFTSALSSRPEIRQARRTLEAAGYGVSAARKTNTPSISANASVGTTGDSDPFQSQSSSIGLGVNWTLFDSGYISGAIQEAKGTQRSALANYRLAQQTVVADVGQAYVDLATAIQRVTINEAGVANAQEGVRLAIGRYRGGVGGTFLDITTAENQLFTAEQSLEIARGDAVRARAALDRAIGRGI